VADRSSVADVRSYYERILPFYELEAISRAHLAFWTALAKELRPAEILEVGAGLGRITEALARQAPSVGIDLSFPMLALAQSRKRPRSRASFVAADMRRFAFARTFDLVVAPGDPFSHLTSLEDRKRALRAVARHLSPRGRFVLEGLHRERRKTESRPRRIRHGARTLQIDEAWYPIGTGNRWHARYRYSDLERGRVVESLSASFLARAWDPGKMRELFRSCGLTIEEMWGDFDRRPFRSGAPRIVVIAKRGPFGRDRRAASGPARLTAATTSSPRRRARRPR
jgi:SAM-dependent methyltransferase